MISESPYGILPDGRQVNQFHLKNNSGIELKVINYGCTITSLRTPNIEGVFHDIVLGFDKLEDYLNSPYYFGCVIGRCANRIASGKFELDGKEIQLSNNFKHHLHGGHEGFDKKLWHAKPFENEQGVGVDFFHYSVDGEEGYPGNVTAYVRYYLLHDDVLVMNFLAATDQPTIVNMTQHSYFNLNDDAMTILDHALHINANAFLPIDEDRLPTGEIRKVARTPFDFSVAKMINDAFVWSDEQVKIAQGMDHCFAIAKADTELGHACTLYAPIGRRTMEVHTNVLGIHIFTGNSIEGTGKNGVVIRPYSGIALETCHFPDAPHHPDFPSIVITPEKKYEQITILKFGILPVSA